MPCRVAFDCHLHFYANYAHERFFRSLCANLDAAGAGRLLRLALLTEAPGCDAFSRWAAPGAAFPGGYSFTATGEPYSLTLTRSGEPLAMIVRGRQIVTAERLEVLTAGDIPPIEDGRPLAGAVAALIAAGALAIVPWGAGKWLGSRGRLVEELAAGCSSPLFFLADNPARPAFWPAPRAFAVMERKGRPVLRGSDPLPLPGEEERAGAFATLIEGEFDDGQPLASLRGMLEKRAATRNLGRRDGPFVFLRRQASLRLNSRKN
jgi:hypothetical protein